jgi:hypothetical protein
VLGALAFSARSQPVQYRSGQNVAPIYHGFEINADWTTTQARVTVKDKK